MNYTISTKTKQTIKDTTFRTLSVIGGIVVLAAIIWVGVRGFGALPNVREMLANVVVSVQSLFSPRERIEVSVVDSQVVVDTPFVLSWEHLGKTSDGSYSFFYECEDGVHFARKTDTSTDTLFCNTEVPLDTIDTQITLIPRGTVEGIATLPVEIRFRETGATAVSETGSLSIRVQDVRFDDATSTTTTPSTPSEPSTPSTPGTTGGVTAGPTYTQTIPIVTAPYSDPNGDPDLSIDVIAIGTVTSSGKFTAGDDWERGKSGAIKFVVENKGTKETGKWTFEATLPTSPSYTYKSPSQQSLFPGDKIEFIIGFTKIKNDDEGKYTIEVDPNDKIDESNEKNNTESDTVDIDR